MVYLFTALYPEAKPVIRYLGLKRRQMEFGFDVYEGERLRLILTGVGAPAAAAAVGSTLAFFHAGEGDFLVNWGSCASDAEIGTVFRCHKIMDQMFHHTFYPDMIFFSDMKEAAVVTEPVAWEKKEGEGGQDCRSMIHTDHDRECSDMEHQRETAEGLSGEIFLHDMEAAAVYFTGSYFFSPHQMHFLKVVTDHGMDLGESDAVFRAEDGKKTDFLKKIEELMQESLPELLAYLELLYSYDCALHGETRDNYAVDEPAVGNSSLDGSALSHSAGQNLSGSTGGAGKSFSVQEQNLEKIYEEFCCSQTMKHSVFQCVKYWHLVQVDYEKELQSMRAAGELPCRDRREGKKKWEKLKQKLL